MKKILFIFPGKIGDTIFALPAIEYLRKQNNNNVEITWLGTEYIKNIIEFYINYTNIKIDKFIIDDKSNKDYCSSNFDIWLNTKWERLYPGYDEYYNSTMSSVYFTNCVTYPRNAEYAKHCIEYIFYINDFCLKNIEIPYLQLNSIDKNIIDKYKYDIVIESSSFGDTLMRNFSRINSIIENLDFKNKNVLNIGYEKNNTQHSKYQSFLDGNFFEVFSILNNCKFFVGINSCFTLFSAILRKPTITLHKYFLAKTHGNYYISPENSIDIDEKKISSIKDIQIYIDDYINKYCEVK